MEKEGIENFNVKKSKFSKKNFETVSSGNDNHSKFSNTPISSETVKEQDFDSETENLKKVEAALFISARFLNLQDLVMLTDINPLMLKELLQKLIDRYNRDDSAIEIIIKENMWKMDVRQDYVPMINKLATGSAEFTNAEQETLAVIAYKQPVKQSVIIKIRGNKAYEHIKHFIEIGLVMSKKAGHTKDLRLSDEFFEYFHLQKKEKGGKIIAVEETNEIDDGEIVDVEKNSGNETNEKDNSKKVYANLDAGDDEKNKDKEEIKETGKDRENDGEEKEEVDKTDEKQLNEVVEEKEEEKEVGEVEVENDEDEKEKDIDNIKEINNDEVVLDVDDGEGEEKDEEKDEEENNINDKKENDTIGVEKNEVVMEEK
ncbi:SMC-Scp complex subunit ScpB [Candidatus Pacearchaeota archaeon]|nr:SMC-Scp complex subunit ScpB [Candidatus Pacearchaeota archaeon]